MRYVLAFLLAVTAPCAFAQASVNVNGLRIEKPALAADGVEGGLKITRDAMSLWGGQYGTVNTALTSRCLIGSNASAFEWCGLFWMDNYSNGGQNVALYAQGQKRGTGITWGQVVELNDTTGNYGGAVVQELDLTVNGPDTGNRIGIDMVLGDARQARGLTPTPDVGASAAIRIQAQNNTPQAKWTRGIWLRSNYVIGLDTSDAVFDAATIRLGEGQQIALEGTGQITVRYTSNRISFRSGGVKLMEVDTTTGNLHIKGSVIGGLQ